jgi:hypothetical protein
MKNKLKLRMAATAALSLALLAMPIGAAIGNNTTKVSVHAKGIDTETENGAGNENAAPDTTKPTLNAAVSEGLLTIQASDNDSGVKTVYVNGYEFTDVTNGTLNIRLSQFDAGYEYFTISAIDNAGNMSETYRTKNPYYSDPDSDGDNSAASQLPVSAEPTAPASATATVTAHTVTDENGDTTESETAEEQKKAEFAKADAQEAELNALNSNSDEDASRATGAGKEFYTIEAASGKVFYLIIDRSDDEETVYFLTEITENDLLNVTSDNSETLPKNSAAIDSQIPVTESALPNNNTDTAATAQEPEKDSELAEEATESETDTATGDGENNEEKKGSPIAAYAVIALLGAAIIGAAYYLKVVRKKQESDFVEDEDDDNDSEYDTGETEPDDGDDFFDM